MRLSHLFFESPLFQYKNLNDFFKILSNELPAEELAEIQRLVDLNLPPITSKITLAALFGINPGIIWSFEKKTDKFYRSFYIPKGNSRRLINAPRVGLKLIQKWISVQLQIALSFPDHVYGFINNRSHIDAAKQHCNAKWVFSVDIKDFFSTTPRKLVSESLVRIGYNPECAELISKLCCYKDHLAQGAPTSPVLSNLCFSVIDDQLHLIAKNHEVRMTRYADDIVFSGENDFPENLKEEVLSLFTKTPWKLSDRKTELSRLPKRLKVHGLLVHGEKVRLTKGYRNKLRAYAHLYSKGAINSNDLATIRGHLDYGRFVEKTA